MAQKTGEAVEKATGTAKMASRQAEAAERAGERAEEAAAKAAKAAESAVKASQELAAKAAEKAEAAAAKFDLVPQVIKQVLGSRQFLLIIILAVLGAIFAAVAISVGLSSLGP
jgi:hypothetical protein